MVTAARRTTKEPVHLQSVWEDGQRLLVIPKQAHTYDGFLKWVMCDDFPEKLRVCFIQGEVSVDMSEECLSTHVAVKSGVYVTLLNLVMDEDLGEFYPDGVLIGNPEAEVSNNPDGVAVLWESFEAGRVRFIERRGEPRAVEGSPDWVLEILSDSSVAKDTKQLREAYHRARIPEYWIIDARGPDISFQILTWRPAGYVAVVAKDGWLASKVFGHSFRMTRKRNRAGHWTYTLSVRRENHKPKTK